MSKTSPKNPISFIDAFVLGIMIAGSIVFGIFMLLVNSELPFFN